MNLEAKNEIGSGGGCCHLQNAAYALLYVRQSKLEKLRNVSRCPTILIELAGPNLSFSAFAYTNKRLVWDQLTPLYPMATSFECGSWVELAKCFSALRKVLLKLEEYEKSKFLCLMDSGRIPDAQLCFPKM